MEANNIKKLFGNRDIHFVIPSYQRAYSWEEKQFSQFLEDLKECKLNEHYLGHFLFEKDDSTFYVIDGQQRLTTLIIFISVIIGILMSRKEEWNNTNPEIKILIDDLNEFYLKDIRHDKIKLDTVSYDKNFFCDLIIEHKDNISENDLTSKSKRSIYNAFLYFKKQLQSLPTDQLLKLINTLENSAITTYIVKDKLQGAQIFAYQNDRGKKLTNLEILKAYFMLQIYISQNNLDNISYVETCFEEIYRQIVMVRLDEDSVLNYYWNARSSKGYNTENVIREVKDWLKNLSPQEQVDKIKYFVNELAKTFSIIHQFENDESFYAVNLKNMNNMADAYPLIIKAKLANVSNEVFNRLVRFLENVVFRSLIRGGRADLTSRLQDILLNLKDTDSTNKMIDHAINNLKKNWWWSDYWGDQQMIHHLDSGWFYGNRVDNYLLWRYEQYLCDKNYPVPKVNFRDVVSQESIEHIAPQTEPSQVKNGYGVYDDKNVKENGIQSGNWLHCVGNLMLMAKSQNSSLGNKPFPDKLTTYGKSNLLHQQKEIINFVNDPKNPIWDKNAIEKRHKKILEAAKEIWNLDNI